MLLFTILKKNAININYIFNNISTIDYIITFYIISLKLWLEYCNYLIYFSNEKKKKSRKYF